MNKDELITSLPIKRSDLTIRYWEREDLDLLSQWPSYPFPNEPFDFSFRHMARKERDAHFGLRERNKNRITLILDCNAKKAIGYLSLVDIDWDTMIVNNIGFRIEPSWCNRGVGKRAMGAVSNWCFEKGFAVLRFDVAASNGRAIHCYQDCGFVKAGEFWRDDPRLGDIDLNSSTYDFLRSHVRFVNGVPQLRFLWMEKRNDE